MRFLNQPKHDADLFRVYCDHSFPSPSILTNIPEYASAPSEKQNQE